MATVEVAGAVSWPLLLNWNAVPAFVHAVAVLVTVLWLA